MVALIIFIALFVVFVFAAVNSLYTLFAQAASPGWLSWANYCRAPVLFTLFLIILWLAIVGKFKWAPDLNVCDVSGEVDNTENRQMLFVLIHGLGGSHKETWKSIAPALKPFGAVLPIYYPTKLSNRDPVEVAAEISSHIEKHSTSYSEIVVIGHSIGALMARQTFLHGAKNIHANSWWKKTKRIVLLAGTNRGWDISGKKPADMRWLNYVSFWVGSWLGRLAGMGELVLATESGAPFVANLRLEWMRWFQIHRDSTLEVVQLLGDIDDIVSAEDNKDLRVNAGDNFVWLRVRGTGHKNILYVRGDDREEDQTLAAYREGKIIAAAVWPFQKLREQNEELPYERDEDVTHLIFILHGIRDLGQWASQFETELRPLAKEANQKIAIASIRYGYFGMGQFILSSDRQKYVRWFMDEYTETLAKYPNVQTVDFIGHSNGTYLMARALADYASLRVDKVVFLGSVVPRDYDWEKVQDRIKDNGVVRNYVAADDWVVALFPRLFELPLLKRLGNDIGSAGFNGFVHKPMPPFVQNFQYIMGHHSAFVNHIPEIARFIVNPQDPGADNVKGRFKTRERWQALKCASDWLSPALWLVIVAPLVWIGFRVTGAATQPASVALLFYVVLVVLLLREL